MRGKQACLDLIGFLLNRFSYILCIPDPYNQVGFDLNFVHTIINFTSPAVASMLSGMEFVANGINGTCVKISGLG